MSEPQVNENAVVSPETKTPSEAPENKQENGPEESAPAAKPRKERKSVDWQPTRDVTLKDNTSFALGGIRFDPVEKKYAWAWSSKVKQFITLKEDEKFVAQQRTGFAQEEVAAIGLMRSLAEKTGKKFGDFALLPHDENRWEDGRRGRSPTKEQEHDPELLAVLQAAGMDVSGFKVKSGAKNAEETDDKAGDTTTESTTPPAELDAMNALLKAPEASKEDEKPAAKPARKSQNKG